MTHFYYALNLASVFLSGGLGVILVGYLILADSLDPIKSFFTLGLAALFLSLARASRDSFLLEISVGAGPIMIEHTPETKEGE